MANEIQTKYRTYQTVQASAAITAGAYSAGSQTDIDNIDGANFLGAEGFDLYIDVTSAPSADAIAEIWMEASYDAGTSFAAAEKVSSVAVALTTADEYHIGQIFAPPPYFKLKIKAIDYTFTASLIVVPMVPEVQ